MTLPDVWLFPVENVTPSKSPLLLILPQKQQPTQKCSPLPLGHPQNPLAGPSASTILCTILSRGAPTELLGVSCLTVHQSVNQSLQEEKGATEDEWLDGINHPMDSTIMASTMDATGLDGHQPSNSTDTNFSKLLETVKDGETWCAAVHGVTKSQTRLRNWTTEQQQARSLWLMRF